MDLAEHSGFTNWEDYNMLRFGGRGKPEYPGEKL